MPAIQSNPCRLLSSAIVSSVIACNEPEAYKFVALYQRYDDKTILTYLGIRNIFFHIILSLRDLSSVFCQSGSLWYVLHRFIFGTV